MPLTQEQIQSLVFPYSGDDPETDIMLFFTDNKNEPRSINIRRCIETDEDFTGNAFNSSKIDKRSASGTSLTLNAQDGQIRNSVSRTVLVELVDGGAAPAQVTVTVQPNIDATSGDFGGKTS